jgi:hypothetical protein
MAIDPTNDQHLVAAWMGFKLFEALIIKTSYSDNGGLTWSTPIDIPHELGNTGSADVSLKYNSSGDVFLCYIDYETTNFTQGVIYVRKSSNGAISWDSPIEALSITDCPGKICLDRPWMAIDNSGGLNNGAIYITSMNADQPTLITPPYNPYMAVSSDNGLSFSSPRTLDTTDYLVGAITQPMPSPTVDANGTFYAAYPSYETSQSPFVHFYLAESNSLGINLDHSNAYTVLIQGSADPFAKKASLLISDPSTPKHLAMFLIGQESGDGDIYFMETFDAISWSTPIRVNDDPSGNGKLQDLVWASFNESGDLAICWRDRRNASANGYQTETEIYGTVRMSGATFGSNFNLSSQQAGHDIVLEGAGNDFMNVNFVGDTLYAIWGDTRSGAVSIYLNKMDVVSGATTISEVYNASSPMKIYPNPAKTIFTIENFAAYKSISLINSQGQLIQNITTATTDITKLECGTYFLHFELNEIVFTEPLQIH